MTRELASIEFESRREVQEILRVVAEYVKQNPKEKTNRILEQFYGYLDVMDMEW